MLRPVVVDGSKIRGRLTGLGGNPGTSYGFMVMRNDAGILNGRARGRTHGYRPYFARPMPQPSQLLAADALGALIAIFVMLLTVQGKIPLVEHSLK